MKYLGRFVLPLCLLGAAVAVWVVASQLGNTDRSEPRGGETVHAAAPLTSVRRLPEFATSSRQVEAIAAALETLPADPGGLACATILVDGQPVLQQRSDIALVPGYAQLLVTGHAAIDILGPDYRYVTAVLANDLADANGRITGGLYVFGSGDPVLMSYLYSRSFRPTLATRTPIEDLAMAVAEAGVARIDGGVIGVDRRYDDQRTLPGWEQFVAEGLLGPLTAFQVDDAFSERAAGSTVVAIPADEPTVFGVEQFVVELERAGVEAFGSHRSLFAEEEAPSLVRIAEISSPPLSEIVLQMMAVNDAGAAELIMKELGVARGGEGSTQAGGQAVQQVLVAQGVDVPVAFRDGSGLDPIGGATCNQLAAAADTIADDHPTLAVLPSYTLPGVFDGRFRDLQLSSDFRMVGGVQGDASGFVGRTVDQGRRITIASIVNRIGGPSTADLEYQQALVELVDSLRLSTTVEALAIDE